MAGNDGLHNQIAQQLAINAQIVTGGTASISNMRGAFPYPKSNIPPAPVTVIGPPKGRQIASSEEEHLFMLFPMRVYVGKIREAAQTQHDINEWVDAFLLSFRNGISLGGLVTDAHIESWDTDKFYQVGDEGYQAVDFVISVELLRTATYTT